jgi:hypothetical protein
MQNTIRASGKSLQHMYATNISFYVNCQRYENIINSVSVLVKGKIDHTLKKQ